MRRRETRGSKGYVSRRRLTYELLQQRMTGSSQGVLQRFAPLSLRHPRPPAVRREGRGGAETPHSSVWIFWTLLLARRLLGVCLLPGAHRAPVHNRLR